MNYTQYIRALIVLLVTLLTIGHSPVRAQVLQLADLNTEQIRALDKEKTVVLIPGGILGQHGPYLPSYTDGYRNEWAAGELSRAIAARPGWTALVFPTIPLGVGGANEIGGIFSFPGTYAVRSTTLRAIFVDPANELGEQGFRWIFLIHLHGAPAHSRVLDEAGDYFRDIYGGRMVHLYGLLPVLEAGSQPLHLAEADGSGLDIHAGRGETSDILFIRPDLVASGYQTAPALPGFSFDDLVRIARSPDWPGYFNAPAQATAAEGKARLEQRTRAAVGLMWQIVEGTADEREIPRYAMNRPEASLRAARAAAAEERVREERFAEWLANQGLAAQEQPQAAAPGEPHAALAQMAGIWEAQARFWVAKDPAKAPMSCTATVDAQMIMGGRFLFQNVEGQCDGQPVEAIGVIGYDNVTGRFQAVDFDNMGTGISRHIGERNDAGDIVLHSSYVDPGTGETINRRTVRSRISESEWLETAYDTRGDTERKVMEIRARRADNRLPSRASSGSGQCLTKTTLSERIRFADIHRAREILGRSDEWARQLSAFDRGVRQRTLEPTSTRGFLEFVSGQAADWTQDEQVYWKSLVDQLSEALEGLSLDIPDAFMVKTTGLEEFNAVYVRNRSIIFPQGRVAVAGDVRRDFFLLAHELFHLLSLEYPAWRDELYALLGFRRFAGLEYPAELEDRRLSNPMYGSRYEYVLTVQAASGPVDVTPAYQAAVPLREFIAVSEGGMSMRAFFEAIDFVLLPVDTGTRAVLRDGSGYPIIHHFEDTDWIERMQRNSSYIIHPDELMAENFALLMEWRRSGSVPESVPGGPGQGFRVNDIELLREIEKVLTAGCEE
jgi:creatinine amidohydrolase